MASHVLMIRLVRVTIAFTVFADLPTRIVVTVTVTPAKLILHVLQIVNAKQVNAIEKNTCIATREDGITKCIAMSVNTVAMENVIVAKILNLVQAIVIGYIKS